MLSEDGLCGDNPAYIFEIIIVKVILFPERNKLPSLFLFQGDVFGISKEPDKEREEYKNEEIFYVLARSADDFVIGSLRGFQFAIFSAE